MTTDRPPTLEDAKARHDAGDVAGSEAIYRELLSVEPSSPNLWHGLGLLLWQRSDLAGAERAVREAVSLHPSDAALHCNLGGILKQRKDLPGAIQAFENARILAPSDETIRRLLAQALGNHAFYLSKAEDWNAAKEAYRKLIALDPQDAAACHNLAQICHHSGEEKEALPLYDKALSLAPENGLLRFNRGICRLSESDLAGGCEDIASSREAWLPHMDGRKTPRWPSSPLWTGETLRGKRLLIWGDQGVGDEILYASLIPDLLKEGARISLECDPALAPLFRKSFPEIDILPRAQPPSLGNAFDFQAPGLWLFTQLRKSFASFPRDNSYLVANPARTSFPIASTGDLKPSRRIGLAWRSRLAGYGASRRIALQDLAAFLPPDFLYIDLQYGDTETEREEAGRLYPDLHLHHEAGIDRLKDLDGLASQIASCDLVIAPANAVAHLAGALGKPAIILVPKAGRTWHWFSARDDSPWHPSLTLLRKTEEADWSGALAELPALIKARMDRIPDPP